MYKVILGLGTNIGDRISNLSDALKRLSEHLTIKNISSVYSTSSLLKDGQTNYYNIVCSSLTCLHAEELLSFIKKTETEMGRVKTFKWGARIIDIDILDYNGSIIKTEKLEIPHPSIPFRSFVLYPLRDISDTYRHPISHLSAQEMINMLTDDLNIKLVSKIR